MNLKSIVSCLFVPVFFFITFHVMWANSGDHMNKNIESINADRWKDLSEKKIYFGHQSVGYNIIDGIKSIMVHHQEVGLNIIETSDINSVDHAGFIHSTIGKNEDPGLKTDDFARIIKTTNGKIDIALYKYCYIDFNEKTNVNKVFVHYKEQYADLAKQFPNINFVHLTVPLTTVQSGPKAWIKKILGRPIGGIESNIKRNEFNKLLLAEYQGKVPVFDLAAVEATQPDGKKTTFEKDSAEYLALYQEYSDDGGHLNAKGQRTIAERLLVFLAGLN